MKDPRGEKESTAGVDTSEPGKTISVGRSSALLASGTIVSRALGFISLTILASAIGLEGSAADTFALANQLPNNVYSLVAGGLLSAVLVPQIVKAGLHDDGGARFINKVITIGIVVFATITAVATVCSPLLVSLYAQSGFSDRELGLATALAYWCLPQILFYALYSLVGEALNARGVFGPFTWAPVLNNIVAISGLVVFISLFGEAEQNRGADGWTVGHVALLAGSATLGIAVQAFSLFFFLGRAGLTYRPDFRWRGVGLARTGLSASWVFAMFLVSQIAGVVESQVASTATGNASINVMKYGWLMFMLPHSIATVSIATAYFTRMSTHVVNSRMDDLRNDISAALRSILLIMVFAFIALTILAMPFSAVFADNTYKETLSLAGVYIAFLVGLIPFTVFYVLLRVFYALEITRSAFIIQVVQTAFYISGALIIGTVVPKEMIAMSLALMLSVSLTLQAVLSAAVLRRSLGRLDTVRVAQKTVWFAAVAIIAGAAGWGILQLLGGTAAGAFPVADRLGAIVSMIVTSFGMLIVYASILWLTRNPELRSFAAPMIERIRRRR
ncbi:MAG: murein biosynthesis integral membrane protein MurJ [Rhodoglobus sp.]